MKCENCGNELVGASVVCRQCNHNITQGRVGQWRARHSNTKSAAPATRSISPLPSPRISPKPEAEPLPAASSKSIESRPSSTLARPSVPFESKPRIAQVAIPRSSAKSSAAASSSEEDSGLVQFPAWRAQLKDKVKEVRERRTQPTSEAGEQPDEAELDPNPIVESALKRIRWSQHLTPSQPAPEQSEAKPETAQQQRQEAEPRAENKVDTNPFQRVQPKPDSKPLPRSTTSTNPLLARKPLAQPVNRTESALRSEPSQTPPSPAETRIEVKPATIAETKPGSGSLTVPTSKTGSGSLTAPTSRTGSGALPPLQKIRTTGEIKKPSAPLHQQSPSQPLPQRTPSGSLVQPPRNHVETQVIGLAPSVSDLTGFAAGTAQSLKPRKASLWGRTLAGACDFEIVAMAYLPIFGPYAVLNTSVGYESFAMMVLLLAALIFCYQLLTLTIANRTTGMAFLRLRLVNATNREKPVSFAQKLLRAFAATVVSFVPPINFLIIQSNPQHRSLPDMISGTMLLERVKSN